MEGYSNYQQVIDAIKAEYVNARDLKRKATTKSRKTDTTGSFKKRKESEVKSLVVKSKSIDSLLDKTLSESVFDLDKSKFKDFKTKLSELNAKLEYIDSESKRFATLNEIDPEGHKKATKTEEQTFSVVRNLLANAIKDVEGAISKIYDGESYSAIVKATKPNTSTHSEDEVRDYYNNLERSYSHLFDKAVSEIDFYTSELFAVVDAMKSTRTTLIRKSQELVDQKQQLADLLDNQAPESDISEKELWIEGIKKTMLEQAKDLKIMDAAKQEWISGKFANISEFVDNLEDMRSDFESFRDQNDEFLLRYPRPNNFLNKKTSELYEKLFQALQDNYRTFEEINGMQTSNGGNSRQGNEFSLVWNELSSGRDQMKYIESEMNLNYKKRDILWNTSRIFDTLDGRENGEVSEFKKGISVENKDFYVKHSLDLHKTTSEYIETKASYDFSMDKVQRFLYEAEEARYNQERYASILVRVKRQALYETLDFENMNKGHYEGTEEQRVAYDMARDTLFDKNTEFLYKRSMTVVPSMMFNIYHNLFGDFYSSLDSLSSVKTSAEDNYQVATTRLENLNTEVSNAYDYLQTLTVGEADYVAALADYEKQSAELQLAKEALNLMDVDSASAYDFLQTTVQGESDYQVAVVEQNGIIDQNKVYQTNSNIAQADAEAFKANAESTRGAAVGALSMAQYDKADYIANADGDIDPTIVEGYDFTINESEATIANATRAISQANATIKMCQEELDQYETNISQAETTLKNATEAHYTYLGAQSDYDSKIANRDAYYTNNVNPIQIAEQAAMTLLQDLTDEDAAYQQALVDWTNKVTELDTYKTEFSVTEVALKEAVQAVDNLSNSYYGNDMNLSIYGSELINAKLEVEDGKYSMKAVDEASNAYEEAQTAFNNARNEMTFVASTPFEGRMALERLPNFEKANDQVRNWETITVEHVSHLTQIQFRISDLVGNLVNNPFFVKETKFKKVEKRDSESSVMHPLLEKVKNFLDNNSQNGEYNRLSRVTKSQKESESQYNRLRDRMDFAKSCVRYLGLPANFGIFANFNEDLLQDIQKSFQTGLIELTDRKILGFNASSFAWQIEDEVNNGNPLVRSQNGGGKS